MDITSVSIAVSLAILGICAYLLARYGRVRRLRTQALKMVVLPPAKVLSWSISSDFPAIECDSSSTTMSVLDQLDAKPAPNASISHDAHEGTTGRFAEGFGTASADAFVASLPSLHDLASIDWSVIAGIRLSAAKSLELDNWANLREYVDKHYFDVGKPKGFFYRLKGYVGEAKAGDHFVSQGADVTFNDVPNVPGYDIKVDGEPVQVKVGGTANTFEIHFDKYPDISVVTGTDNLNIVPEGADVSFLEDLDADQITEMTNESLDIIQDDFDAGGSVIPSFTLLSSGLQQFFIWIDGDTDLSTAFKNVGLDAAGVGLGGSIGAATGALVGSLLGPVGMVAGGFLGRIAGVVSGKVLTNELKYAELKARTKEYQRAITVARKAVEKKQTESHRHLEDDISTQEKELSRYADNIHSVLKTQLHRCHQWHECRCVAFVKLFPKVLEKVEKGLQEREEKELQQFKQSSMPIRVFWPKLDDVRYRLVKASFKGRFGLIAGARTEFSELASRIPTPISTSAGIQEIERFVRENPFESTDFDHICQQLTKVTAITHRQGGLLRVQANTLCKKEYSKRVTLIQSRIRETIWEVSEFVSHQAKNVEKAKDRLEMEARKVGVDLAQQPEA